MRRSARYRMGEEPGLVRLSRTRARRDDPVLRHGSEQRPVQPDRPHLADPHPGGGPDPQAGEAVALVPDRDRAADLHRGRRGLLQLRGVPRAPAQHLPTRLHLQPGRGRSLPRDRRHALPGRLSLPDRGDGADGARANPRARPFEPARLVDARRGRRHRLVGTADLAVHPPGRPRPEDQAHGDGLPDDGPAPGRGVDPTRRGSGAQTGGLLPDDRGDRGPVRDRRDLRVVRPVHGERLPARSRLPRVRMDGVLRAPGHRRPAPVDAPVDRADTRTGRPPDVRAPRPADVGRPRPAGPAVGAELPWRARRYRGAQHRLDRPVPPGRGEDVGTDPSAGTVHQARTCPPGIGLSTRDRDEPRRDPLGGDRCGPVARRHRRRDQDVRGTR